MSEYDDFARWYDLLWPLTDDLPFYAKLAEKHGSPILELGCGTGRVAWDLVRRGYEVVGIDRSAGMLEHARKRGEALGSGPGPEFQVADMTDFDLGRTFNLVIAPFSTMLTVRPPERIATYRRSLAHLAPGGALVVDSWFRGTGKRAGWGNPRPPRVVTYQGAHALDDEGTVVQHFESYDVGPRGEVRMHLFLDVVSRDGTLRRRTYTLRQHYASPERMEREIREAGFGTVEVYGGWGLEPLYAPSLTGRGRQIFIAYP